MVIVSCFRDVLELVRKGLGFWTDLLIAWISRIEYLYQCLLLLCSLLNFLYKLSLQVCHDLYRFFVLICLWIVYVQVLILHIIDLFTSLGHYHVFRFFHSAYYSWLRQTDTLHLIYFVLKLNALIYLFSHLTDFTLTLAVH